ncbi:MAG: hypothetical protein RMJ44_05875 [Cytophagales bacterium]|nr:hypothetical protein [Bernardetiaceae bacterium]MDW8210596.1 hypothetical protein [Cytophagales bacterium]
MNSARQEMRDRQLAGILTIVICAVLLVVFIFTVVWSPPDPPIPLYGIEINFGTVNAGSGSVQSRARPSSTPTSEELPPTMQPNPATTQQVTESPLQKIESPVSPPPVATQDPHSPDIRQEQKNFPSAPGEQTQKLEQPSTWESGKGSSQQSHTANNGNSDQGKPEGSLNTDALLDGGSNGGTSLDLVGWTWETHPVVNDYSSETGRLEFEIRVDKNGEVVGVRLLFRSVSPSVARVYEEALREVTFRPTSAGSRPSITVGRVVFNITAK